MDTLIHLKWLVWEDQHSQNVEEWTYLKIKKLRLHYKAGMFPLHSFSTFKSTSLSWKLPFVQKKNGLKHLQITNLNLMELVSISFFLIQCFFFFPFY